MSRKPFPIEAVRRSIRRLMSETNDKAKPLAIRLNLGETGIRDIFLEKTKSVKWTKLTTLADYFGVTVDSIVDGTATTKIGKTAETLSKSPGVVINLPVQLPNEDALTEMFAALLEAIDVDPHQDERAERLALCFPSALQAASQFAAAADPGLKNNQTSLDRTGLTSHAK